MAVKLGPREFLSAFWWLNYYFRDLFGLDLIFQTTENHLVKFIPLSLYFGINFVQNLFPFPFDICPCGLNFGILICFQILFGKMVPHIFVELVICFVLVIS